MESNIIVALVVVVAIAAHLAIFHWVKFKIHEGVILKYLREDAEGGATTFHRAEKIARHTEISAKRVAAVCQKSAEIQADPVAQDSWRAPGVSA